MMSRSEGELIAARLRDGECIRGCTLAGVHWASCDGAQVGAESSCRGCAPRPAHTGSVVCGGCFGRMRGLLRDAGDILGRVRSQSDQARAVVYRPVKVHTSTSQPDQVDDDVLEVVVELLRGLRDFAFSPPSGRSTGHWHSRTSTLTPEQVAHLATLYATQIDKRLTDICADPMRALRLAALVLDTHPPVDGVRSAWSLQDARDRWGAERYDRHVHPDVEEDPDRVESRTPVREWHDPLLDLNQAAERADVHVRTIRKWIKAGELAVAARVRVSDGSVLRWVRASDVDAAKARPRETPGRKPRSDADTTAPIAVPN